MQTLFKNGNLVDFEQNIAKKCHILVENGILKKIEYGEDCHISAEEEVNLENCFVLPPFVNSFCDSFDAYEKTYGKEINRDISSSILELMFVKNTLAGAIYNDISGDDKFQSVLLDEIELKTDLELSDIVEDVAKNKKRLFVKCGQNLQELGTIDLQYKKSLPEVLEDFGILDRESVIVGGNCFEKDDLELFSQYDCAFCLTVAEDGKLGRRPTNLLTLKNKDICVSMGSGSSFEIDFFAFMRQLIMTQRGLFENVDCVNEQDAFEIVTTGGAKVLKLEKYGVEEGNFANFIVVDNEISLYDNILKSLVWEKSKKDIKMTVLNGQIIQKNGEILMKNGQQCDKIKTTIQRLTRRN